MSYNSIRRSFLEYFQKQNHAIVASSSLVPAEDPTLLFTNAGMNQFKDIFLGIEQPVNHRTVSVQRCVRAGGKHNDLENVGYTSRHHTFFEMLGNFSFGDYFKREAIELAFNYLTLELNIPLERLWFTVHHEDHEAYALWHDHMKIPAERIIRCGDKDNFWAMGDVGPCGPCSEIFYDHGPSVSGGLPGSDDADGDRFMEIWNLVFMQYHRQANGEQSALPKPCVDTGMGLERLACVLEGVTSNFETSLFRSLKENIMQSVIENQVDPASLNVLADHLRSSVFIIADGITPAAEGRGYVLRRLIRRALRHGYKMNIKKPFLHKHVGHLVTLMQEAYPFLINKKRFCEDILLQEESLFFQTLQSGMKYFTQALMTTQTCIDGETLFKLYDTYGFPIDIALDESKERGLTCDIASFEVLMDQRKIQSRQAQHQSMHADITQLPVEPSVFLRDTLSTQARITALLPVEGMDHLNWICLDQTPFYAESGGQIGDKGFLKINSLIFNVIDTQKLYHQIGLLVEHVGDSLKLGDSVQAVVDSDRRLAIAQHHTATHLLHAALRTLLGPQVQQKGSLVTAERLRFDFSYEQALTPEQLHRIEHYCQEHIDHSREVITTVVTKEQALEAGALAFFEDKYGQTVRMLTIGDGFSKELCGGTHIKSLSELLTVVILSEESVGAGVRRIQALTGRAALAYLNEQRAITLRLAHMLNVKTQDTLDAVFKLQETLKEQSLEWQRLTQKNLALTLAQAPLQVIKDCALLIQDLPATQGEFLKNAADLVRSRAQPLIGLITCFHEEKLSLVITCSTALTQRARLKEIFAVLKDEFDLKGGGRPDLIQAGTPSFDRTQVKSLIERFIVLLTATLT